MPKIYHAKIGLPKVTLPSDVVILVYGPHAKRAARTDRYVDLRRYLPIERKLHFREIIEIELSDSHEVTKLVVRFPITEWLDAVLVLSPLPGRPGALFVRTVWANHKDDVHNTLDKERYARPEMR